MNIQRIVSGLIIIFSTALQAMAGTVCDSVDIAWLSEQAPLPKGTEIVLKRARSGLCEVVVAIDGNLAPIYAGKDFIIAGSLYQNKVSVTRDTMAELKDVAKVEREKAQARERVAAEKRKTFFKARHAELDQLTAMTFGPGNAKKTVYVVTDPNCPHCKKLLPLMEEMAFEGQLRLKLILFPVLGEKSRNMAIHALCNDFTYGQYMAMNGEETAEACERSTQLLSNTEAFFKSADISFVPMVLAGDGTWMVEGSNINKIRSFLGLDCDPEADGGHKPGCGAAKVE